MAREFLPSAKEALRQGTSRPCPERKLSSSRTVYSVKISAKNNGTIKTFAKTDTRNSTIPEGNSKRGTGDPGRGEGGETGKRFDSMTERQ